MKKGVLGCGLATLLLGGLVGAVLLIGRHGDRAESSAPPTPSARVPTAIDVAETIYDGGLGEGWQDWGWGPHQLGTGAARVRFSDYGGIVLHHAMLEPSYAGLVFRFQADGFGQFLAASLKGREGSFPIVPVEPRHIASLPGGWREALIPFSELNPANAAFDRVVLTARVPVAEELVSLDRIVLTKAAKTATPPIRPAELQVLCGLPTHPINPWIYGGTMEVWDAAQPMQRIGGNPLSRMNWELGFWNTGSDWFFENHQAPALRDLLARTRAHGSPPALVVPTVGWVAKDGQSVGFPKSKFKVQRKFDSNQPEAGDGFRPDGSKLVPGDPSETSVAAPPELIGKWIRALRDRDRAANTRSVGMYILDNEPALWDVTHRDVHPKPETYDELLDRTLRYGAAIRSADPDGLIAGPAEWGWAAYYDSAADRDTGLVRPDRKAHGDTPLIPWYLKSLAEQERRTGTKILDVLDVHFYPAAEHLYGEHARTDPEGAALRIRSTRALWDPDYVDESWINDRIKLIPRLKEWVANNYPGLKISLGEWSFGAEEDISGGIATAEALGRFGQQGLDAAFYWGGPKAGTPAFWAFRAYLNFDGAGGRFQDISLATRDQDGISVFASRDPASSRLVVVLVNRDAALAMRAKLRLNDCGRALSYRAFSFAAGASALSQGPERELTESVVSETIAPYSFTVLDVRLATSDADH